MLEAVQLFLMFLGVVALIYVAVLYIRFGYLQAMIACHYGLVTGWKVYPFVIVVTALWPLIMIAIIIDNKFFYKPPKDEGDSK